ncbi:MAG: 4Fe-4S dicluster domain-containing protein [Candidatus Firestonebacteria bacterium]
MKYLLEEKNFKQGFRKDIERLSKQKISNCYQCGKCSAGCPMAFKMDYPPTMIMRMIQLGMHDKVMGCNTSWYCVSCETCTTRCPREIDIAKVMDTLKIMAQAGKYEVSDTEIPIFDWIFMKSLQYTGKVYEIGLIAAYNTLSLNLFKDVFPMGIRMFLKGKINILPHFINDPVEMWNHLVMFSKIKKKQKAKVYEIDE